MANGIVHGYKVATTLAAYRIVYVSAANTCAYLNTVTSLSVGVTIDDVLDTNQAIPVQHNGIARVVCNDTFAAGALITGDSNGKGVAYTAVTTGTAFIGTALEACAATGTVVQVAVNPGFSAIP